MIDSKELVCSNPKETYDPTGNPDQELEFDKGPPNQNNSESIRNPRNPYNGVYLKRGLEKWTSEIWDPFTGRRFYLGLFTSAEAALEAYCAKKLEIENKHAKDASISQCHLPNEHLEVDRHRKNTYKGVCLRKTGKWTAMINDPYTHVPLFLGTFATEEAANEAYCASKLELDQKRAASNESCGRGKRERKPVGKPKFESPKKKPRINSGDVPYKGVRKTPVGKFDATIWDPVSKTKCYLGFFESAEAAHSAYCAKKLKIDLKISKFAKSCKKLEIGEENEKKRGTKQKSQEAAASVWSECSLLEECKPCLEKMEDVESKSDFCSGYC